MSAIGGAKVVMINELRPGEEQTVSVMQQAPNGVVSALHYSLECVSVPP